MREQLKLPQAHDGHLWHYRNLGPANVMHHHAELEFNLVTAGRGRYLLENRSYEIRRGDLLWLFPAQEHVLVEQSADFEMWIGVLKPQALQRIATDASARLLRAKNPPGQFCRRLPLPACVRLEKLFLDIAAAPAPPGLVNAGLAFAFLRTWQHFLHADDVPVHDVHPAVEKAARLIRDESSHLNLDALAARAGLSAPRLSRLFKQQTGVALTDFRNRQRVERFLAIYGTGQRRTMLAAALEAGFGSYPQFHRVFKRVAGRAPILLRRPASPKPTAPG
jgi:AraC-like DNA-binding protein